MAALLLALMLQPAPPAQYQTLPYSGVEIVLLDMRRVNRWI